MAQKRDLFGILLIGFGKSLIFQLLPHLLNRLKELWKLERVCVLVVTLLVSTKLMKDQVEELTHLGVRAFAIGLGDEKGEKTLIAFPSLLRLTEGLSPVGDRTAVDRLELLVGIVH